MLLMSDASRRLLFDETRTARLRELAEFGDPFHATNLADEATLARLADVEVLITSWACPPLDEAALAAAPKLKAALHGAGSVRNHITQACWDHDLLVTTAAEANAIPVAEYTVAAILQAGKRVLESATEFRAIRNRRSPTSKHDRSNYQRTVGVIGFSRIGRRVVRHLQAFDFDVLVADPFADARKVAESGANLVELDDLLRRSDVVSVHASALPSTRHLLDARAIALVPDGGTVINTARGMLVDTDALAAECATGRLSAVLDVTDPEPLPADSPLWDMPNVQLTPHIAGALDTEVHRLADSVLDELGRYTRGEPPVHPVTADEIERIA